MSEHADLSSTFGGAAGGGEPPSQSPTRNPAASGGSPPPSSGPASVVHIDHLQDQFKTPVLIIQNTPEGSVVRDVNKEHNDNIERQIKDMERRLTERKNQAKQAAKRAFGRGL